MWQKTQHIKNFSDLQMQVKTSFTSYCQLNETQIELMKLTLSTEENIRYRHFFIVATSIIQKKSDIEFKQQKKEHNHRH